MSEEKNPIDEIKELKDEKLAEVFFTSLEMCRKTSELKYKKILSISFAELSSRNLMGLDVEETNSMLEMIENIV